MEVSFNLKKIVKILVVVIVILTAMSLAGQIYKYHGGRDRYLVRFFDLDGEWNLPTFYQSSSLLFCSFMLAIIALGMRRKGSPFYNHWRFLSFIFILLALDETVQLHEQIITPLRNLLHAGGFFYYAWVVPESIFVVVFFIAYLKFLIQLSNKNRWLFMISGGLYVFGALGWELIGGYYAEAFGKTSLTYALLTDAEELFEMIGILIFLYTLMNFIKTEFKSVRFEQPFLRRELNSIYGQEKKMMPSHEMIKHNNKNQR